MKVYVINFHHVLNYGAVIQGYALCKFLINNGYDAKIIDYRPKYFLSQTYRPARGVLKTFKKWAMAIAFYRFRKEHLPLTEKILFGMKDLERYFAQSNDAFVCGSDQVWNTQLTNGRIDPGYFLDFVPGSAAKIAYAASIGHSKFDRTLQNEISKTLSSYHAISVREDFAKEEVYEISKGSLDPKLVLDPTLLLDDYSEILDFSLVPKEEYIVVYTTENSRKFRKYVNQVSKALGLKIINLGHYATGTKSVDYTNVNPSKWLGLFSKAKYVCTNSFHGTAFSIIFRKNFSVFGRETKKDLNRRQLTLMSNLEIEHRFIHELEDFDAGTHLSEIPYEGLEPKLRAMISESGSFLLDVLKEL